MTKFVIVNKSKSKGTSGDDAANLFDYMELGWELMVTRIKTIRALQHNEIANTDIIITTDERKFLYTKLFPNVMSINDFASTKLTPDLDYAEDCEKIIADPSIYYNLIHDCLDEILTIDYSDLKEFQTDKKFICFLIRVRDHCPERNSNFEYCKNTLKELCDRGYLVYVGGKGAEQFCVHENSIYVDKLRDWASLIHHDNCLAIIGPTSGGSGGLGQLCGKSKMLLFDPGKISLIQDCFGTHPLFFGRSTNFTDIPFRFYLEEPSVEQIIDDIDNWNFRLGRC